MKGKLINMMRRWWLMALVSTLALSLTSCAKRRNFNLSGRLKVNCICDTMVKCLPHISNATVRVLK